MKLLTSAQVASRTGLDASSVLKHARRKRFPGAYQVNGKGSRWVFTVASVIAFKASR